MKKPYLVFIYSLIAPGLGQLYLGESAKGWTFLSMTGGIVVSLIVSHTMIAWILMGGIYLAIMIPAALDAFQTASGRPRVFAGDSRAYAIGMLLLVGPFALPLLWQSGRFSKIAKIAWTLVVILIALLGIVVLAFSASFLDPFMKQAAG